MAETITSLDYSDYEGADISHDMNVPTPEHLEEKFDAIIDGGTLEHVFNFPVAISNCMRLIKSGGRMFIFTPANNQMGHGFYQFSPEVFFRTFCPSNGFEIERMIAVEFRHMEAEYGSFQRQYIVRDPDRAGARVTLRNSHPVALMIQAMKVSHKSRPFERYPQQSDYLKVWDGKSREHSAVADRSDRFDSVLRHLARRLPLSIRKVLALNYHRYFTHSFRNRTSYVPIMNRK